MVTPARTLYKFYACKTVSNDTERHFLLTISDINQNKELQSSLKDYFTGCKQ